jgi:hypothetical protein
MNEIQRILIQTGIKTASEALQDFLAEINHSHNWIHNISVVTPGYEETNTVEGSIVEPVTDPARLLEAEHAILPKGTELTPGRELAFDLPIIIMRD